MNLAATIPARAAAAAVTAAAAAVAGATADTAAARARCGVGVMPRVGTADAAYELRGWVPGRSTKVAITITRVGDTLTPQAPRLWVFLARGATSWRGVFFHKAEHEPLEPLEPGRYVVTARSEGARSTCVARTSFAVTAGG